MVLHKGGYDLCPRDDMNDLFYRIQVALLKTQLAGRQLLFQIYIYRRKSNLAGADLSYLNFAGLKLRGANLREANLTRADLDAAIATLA